MLAGTDPLMGLIVDLCPSAGYVVFCEVTIILSVLCKVALEMGLGQSGIVPTLLVISVLPNR